MSTTRRRGQELLRAIHEATLTELSETGYARLTMERVATRAATGKAALYRRWPTKRELVLDALDDAHPATPPDDADLRTALTSCFTKLAAKTAVIAELLVERDFRATLLDRWQEPVRLVLVKAVERGEIPAAAVTPLVTRTGPALLLEGFLTTGSAPSRQEIDELVDLVTSRLLTTSLSKDILNDVPAIRMPRHQHRDPKALRALAHPVRVHLLELLVLAGKATATELADKVGESPANTSWHLRQLAMHGYIEPAGGGTGRERPWRYVPRSYRSGTSDEEPELAAASDALSLMIAEREFDQFRMWQLRHRSESPEWDDAGFTVQSLAWLTPDEFGDLDLHLAELFTDHMERMLDPAERPAGGRLARLFAWGIPS